MKASKVQKNQAQPKIPEKSHPIKTQGKSPAKPSPSSALAPKPPAKVSPKISSNANFAEKAPDKHLQMYPEEVKHQKNYSPHENTAVHNKPNSADNQNLSIEKIIEGYINNKLKSSHLIGSLKSKVESDAKLHSKKSLPNIVMNPNTQSSKDLSQNLEIDSKIDREFIESIEKYFFNKFQEKNTKEEKKNTFNEEPADILLQLNKNHERKIKDLENMLQDRMNEICESDKKYQSLENDFEKVQSENNKLTEKNRDLEKNFQENSNIKIKAEECFRKNSSLEIEMNKHKKDLENELQLRMKERSESDNKYKSLEKDFEKVKTELAEMNRVLEIKVQENSNIRKQAEECFRKNSSLETEMNKLKKDLENEIQLKMNERSESDNKFQSLEKDFEKVIVKNNELAVKIRDLEKNSQENSNIHKKGEEYFRNNSSLETEIKKLKSDLENEIQLKMNERSESDNKYQSLEKDFENVIAKNNELAVKIRNSEKNAQENLNSKINVEELEEYIRKNSSLETDIKNLKTFSENDQDLISEFQLLGKDLAQAMKVKLEVDLSKKVDLIDLQKLSLNLKSNLNDLLQEHSGLKVIENEVNLLVEENKRLKADLEDSQLETNHLFEHYQNIQEELIEKEINVNEISNENYKLITLLNELKLFAFQIENENKTYNEKIANYEALYLKELESRG